MKVKFFEQFFGASSSTSVLFQRVNQYFPISNRLSRTTHTNIPPLNEYFPETVRERFENSDNQLYPLY